MIDFIQATKANGLIAIARPPNAPNGDLSQWQLLNDIHGGLLVYNGNPESAHAGYYFATRTSRWIAAAAVTKLLERGLIEQAGLLAGVYCLSVLGRETWAMMPDIVAEGRCDYCGRVRQVRPYRQEEAPGVRFLCETCGRMVSAAAVPEAA